MSFKNFQNQHVAYEVPNVCPHCHIANQPTLNYYQHDRRDNSFYSVWNCTYAECMKFYGIRHLYNEQEKLFKISVFLGGNPKGPDWPQPILNLKDGKTIGSEDPETTRFIATYLQSLEAESKGLDEIAGMGYRKSIEYLIKDWAIANNQSDIEKIEKLWLAGVINEYFEGDLKEILDRATWLGNDQSHYNKLFEEYDLSILKELIGLIMVELDRTFKKQHYIESIEKSK